MAAGKRPTHSIVIPDLIRNLPPAALFEKVTAD